MVTIRYVLSAMLTFVWIFARFPLNFSGLCSFARSLVSHDGRGFVLGILMTGPVSVIYLSDDTERETKATVKLV